MNHPNARRCWRRGRGPDYRTIAALLAGVAAIGGAVVITPNLTGSARPRTVASTDALGTPQCNTGYQPQSGFQLDVCISATGSSVTPSVNVTAVPASAGSNCAIVLEIWDDANDRLDSSGSAGGLPCQPGKAPGATLDLNALRNRTAHTSPDGSLTVHAFARLYVDGTAAAYVPGKGDSPAITVSASGTPSSPDSSSASSGSAPSRSTPASMPGPAGVRDVGTVTATPVSSFFNTIKAALDATQGIQCFQGDSLLPCVTSPWAFAAVVDTAAQDAGVDPRLLLDIVVGERGAHNDAIPHTSAIEFARWLLSLVGQDHSLGLTNLSSSAFADAQKAAGPNSPLANRKWTDLIGDSVLAVDASAWILRGLEQKLPASWPADYKRDELLAAGYNGGGSIMLAIATGQTPDQADPTHPGKVASYLDVMDTGWNTVDWYMCHSGAYTCSG